jgi:transcriptional regulator with XRE-family HTH domain
MKIQMIDDGTHFFGAPVDIARRLRGRAHTKTRDLDAYMQKIAGEYGFDLKGDALEDRCDAFLAGLIAKGPARPVFAAGVDMHAVKVLRKALGHSREKLAQLLGVTLMTVTRWETGEHAIASDRLEGIKRVLFDPLAASEPGTEEVGAVTQLVQTHVRKGSLMSSRQRVRQQMRSVQLPPVAKGNVRS